MRILRKAQRFLRDRNPELTYCYRQYCCLKQQQGTLRPIQAQLYLLRLNGRFYLRGRRSLSTLQVPQYQTIARPIIPSLAEQSPQQLAEQMLQYDAVSFDVFDTLLLRPALRPSDLFAVVGSRLHLPDFPNMRIQAEQEARRKDRCAGGTGEITLAAIYQELQQKTGLSAALGMQTEWNVECDLCYANPYLLEVFERVRAAGMPLYVTSDMYLPEEQIRQLLERNGFSGFRKILVSCMHGGGKYNGVLFRVLQETAGTSRILHVGDRLDSDVRCARQAGLDAVQIPAAVQIGLPFWPIFRMTSTIGSAYGGMVNGWLYHGANACSPQYAYGFACGGILWIGFCGWLLEQAAVPLHADLLLEQVEQLLRGTSSMGAVFYDAAEQTAVPTMFWDTRASACYFSEQEQQLLPSAACALLWEDTVQQGILDAARWYLRHFAKDPAWMRISKQDAVAPLLALCQAYPESIPVPEQMAFDKKMEKK